MGEEKAYIVRAMKAKCDCGTMENYLNVVNGHGVYYKGEPLLNANDHYKDENLSHFGDCNSKKVYEDAKKQADEKYKAEEGDGFFESVGKGIGKFFTKAAITAKSLMFNKCDLQTPTPWIFTNEEHVIDGAPALTIESKCACLYGGVITIVMEVEEAPEKSVEEEQIDEQQKQEFLQMMQESYGFDEEQAALVFKAYECFMNNEENKNLSREEQIHKFFANMAGLCINYSGGAMRWKLVCDTPSTLDAMKYFEQLGLSKDETFDLLGLINFQHSNGNLLGESDYNSQGFCSKEGCNHNCGYSYHIRDNKYYNYKFGDAAKYKDFAHEIIQYACFSNDSWEQEVLSWGLGDLHNLTSYKGDVYSTRMEIDDKNSDLDAMNIYQRFLNYENEDILKVMTDYNNGVSSGKINRAKEFLEMVGDGDAEVGYKRIEEDLNNIDIGSQYIDQADKGIGGFIWSIIQDALYTDAMISSGVPLLGEETFEDVMDYTNKGETKNNEKINETKKEFLDYLYSIWKGK